MSTAPSTIPDLSSAVNASVNRNHVFPEEASQQNFHISPNAPNPLINKSRCYTLSQTNSCAHQFSDQWDDGLRFFCQCNDPPVVLVDMDNTLVNWESQFERLMKHLYPQIPIVPPNKRRHFKIELNYDDEYRDKILHLTSINDFWLSMEPVQGALEALRDMNAMGILVFIVTTPDANYTSRCAQEKILWIERHLGHEWKMRCILTHDKTLVNGDILIDDKPAASCGLFLPSWTHILFSQPYNIDHGFCPRLDNWSNWGPAVYNALLLRQNTKHIVCSTCDKKLRFKIPSFSSSQRSRQVEKNDHNDEEQTVSPEEDKDISIPPNACCSTHFNSYQ